jgi:hypothetical protein
MPPLDALDAFQFIKAIYAFSLIFSWVLGVPVSIGGVSAALEHVTLIPFFVWPLIFLAYAIAASTCLFWRHEVFQLCVSLVSLLLWSFNGFISLQLPEAAPGGIFQIFLAIISIWALYYRGRDRNLWTNNR